METSWSDIQTKGFVVVPSFFSIGECQDLLAQYRGSGEHSGVTRDPSLRSPRLGPETKNRFAPRILAAAKRVGSCTTTNVDFVRSGQYYAVEGGVRFWWHVDHDSYYLTQDSVNYLNFWIPIQKSDRNKSGICVAPFDAMRTTFPELARWAIGNGAIDCRPGKGITKFFDLDRLKTLEFPGSDSLQEIAVIPEVGPGDLILMRGDVFHRTQDNDTDRIAISFRALWSQSTISRLRLANMGFSKFYTMAGKRVTFAKRFAAFEIAGKETLTVAESEAICEALTEQMDAVLKRLGVNELNNEQFRHLVWDFALEYSHGKDALHEGRVG